MKISIQNQEKEILIQTVSLSKNEENPENLYLFRCPYCSTSISQIQGVVSKISPGSEPTDEVKVIHQCSECKRLYVFQTLEYSGKIAKVSLIHIPGAIGIFYCWLCRNPLLNFSEDKIVKLPEFELKRAPFDMNCVNPSCPAKYKIVDII